MMLRTKMISLIILCVLLHVSCVESTKEQTNLNLSNIEILILKSDFNSEHYDLLRYDFKDKKYYKYSTKNFAKYFDPIYDNDRNRIFIQTRTSICIMKGDDISRVVETNEEIFFYSLDVNNELIFYTKGDLPSNTNLFRYDLKTKKEILIPNNKIYYLSNITLNRSKILFDGEDGYIYISDLKKYHFSPLLKGKTPSISPYNEKLAYSNDRNQLCIYDIDRKTNKYYDIKKCSYI